MENKRLELLKLWSFEKQDIKLEWSRAGREKFAQVLIVQTTFNELFARQKIITVFVDFLENIVDSFGQCAASGGGIRFPE